MQRMIGVEYVGRTNRFAIAAIAMWFAIAAMSGTVIGQTKAAAPKPQDKLALGEEEVKQLLLLMDTDKNGKISKEEYMKFMERSSTPGQDKSGDLDVKELTQSKLRVSHSSVGR